MWAILESIVAPCLVWRNVDDIQEEVVVFLMEDLIICGHERAGRGSLAVLYPQIMNCITRGRRAIDFLCNWRLISFIFSSLNWAVATVGLWSVEEDWLFVRRPCWSIRSRFNDI